MTGSEMKRRALRWKLLGDGSPSKVPMNKRNTNETRDLVETRMGENAVMDDE